MMLNALMVFVVRTYSENRNVLQKRAEIRDIESWGENQKPNSKVEPDHQDISIPGPGNKQTSHKICIRLWQR